VQRPAKTLPKPGDPLPRFIDTLGIALNDSKKFEVMVYSPDHPSIKVALIEHRLAVADLLAPIKAEALGHIAHAVGTHYALLLTPTFDRQGFAADMNFLSDSDSTQWRSALQDRVVVENIQGRQHLKPAAVIALAVDAITGRVGAPSHLADGLKIAPDRLIRMTPKKSRAETARANTDSHPAGATPDAPVATKPKPDSTGASAPSDATAKTGATDGAGSDAAQPSDKSASQPSARKSAAKKTDAKKSVAKKTDTGAARVATANQGAHPPIAAGSAPKSGAATGDAEGTDTITPVARPDYAGMAQRYQASGDLASAIFFWRRAIDLDPYNAELRRHLIQSYVDRHLAAAARQEATRSLTLMPGDVGLMHLYADTLVASGDVPGALKVYRDLAQRAPQDVTAQVALADALLADNQFAAAIDAYQAATRIDAHSPLPHRRLARVYFGRADSDLTQYDESLKEITLARSLTPAGDTSSYESDYVPLMLRLDARLHDLADTLQNLYEAAVQGKKTTTELQRATTDLRERVTRLADYLDALPPAAGQDDAHAHYTQAAALLLQGVGTFRRYLTGANVTLEDARGPMQVARMDTLGALNQAGKRLAAAGNAVKGNN
jgi:tetratricopeptide (TPR) repeat protein